MEGIACFALISDIIDACSPKVYISDNYLTTILGVFCLAGNTSNFLAMALALSPELLTQAARAFLPSFDMISTKVQFCPCKREHLRSLTHVGFTNMVPSVRCFPFLLSGPLVRGLLSSTIRPDIRILKYPYRIPIYLSSAAERLRF